MGTRDVGLSLRQGVQRNADGIAIRTLTADGQRIANEASSLPIRLLCACALPHFADTSSSAFMLLLLSGCTEPTRAYYPPSSLPSTLSKQMSWAELEREVGLLSRFLAHVPAVEPGDRLGVLGRNSAEYLKVTKNIWPLSLYVLGQRSASPNANQ